MNELLEKLLALLQGQQPPAPRDANDLNVARPWDSPVLQHPSLQRVPRTMMGGEGIATTGAGDLTPADDALVQALLKQRINQAFAKAGNQPIPR